MGKYAPGLSFKDVCEMELEQIEHALEGELAVGENEQGFVYAPAPAEKCREFIIDAYKECAFQALSAMHSGRALDKLWRDACGGEKPEGYLQKYIKALRETAMPDDSAAIGEDEEE